MSELITFEPSSIIYRGIPLLTGRTADRDVIVAPAAAPLAESGLQGGEQQGDMMLFPANYANMLVWERVLAPERRLIALNRSGQCRGFGAGNRIVISWNDLPDLRYRRTFGGWDGIFAAMLRSNAPFWFIQQSIVRELLPEGVDPKQYPGIGHTGGYGPRELLRAGLFAFASQGGYTRCDLPIGADADHAIIVGHDEESLADSIAFNKLAIRESRDYTKFTVDTSHLFDFAVTLSAEDERRLRDVFAGRTFKIPNLIADRPGFRFEYDEREILKLGRKYWRACAVHREIYDYVASVRAGQPFDYELSLDETPQATPPRDLLFYLVWLEEGLGVPSNGVASAGPNLGFIKRHDYEGDLDALWEQVNACASILEARGAMLSVHSADGVRASTGKGPGVDVVLLDATNGRAELKVADVYQEVLWQVLDRSENPAEREIFLEAWRRTYEAANLLAAVYEDVFAGLDFVEAQRLLASEDGRQRILRRHGHHALAQAQGAIGYGLPVFKLAQDLLAVTDPTKPSADAELFRRFMFLTYRALRPYIFRSLDRDGWQRIADALDEATMVRLRAMLWNR